MTITKITITKSRTHTYLEEQDERHPLIVGDFSVLSFVNIHWYRIHHGDEVRVLNPAVVLRIRFIRSRELSGTPAVDRIPDELPGTDQYREYDQQEDGIDVVHPVNPVIAPARAELLKWGHCPQQACNPVTRQKTWFRPIVILLFAFDGAYWKLSNSSFPSPHPEFL